MGHPRRRSASSACSGTIRRSASSATRMRATSSPSRRQSATTSMFLSERTVAPYRYRHGSSPLIVSMPHVGTFVPHSVGRGMTEVAVQRGDTDWHLPRLYDFLDELDATVIVATHSRYVIDVNRPPDGTNLYPGRDTPKLCPTNTFDSQPLYRSGEPPGDEIARRVDATWQPYHRRIAR